jgi:hypothetical protein
MGSPGGTQNSTTKTELDPEFKKDVRFAIDESRRIYQGLPAAPSTLAPEQSQYSIDAIRQAAERAQAGSPLVDAAQAEQLATIQGRGVNPFLSGALEQANRLSGDQYTKNIQALQSQASSMGRYGSGAQGQQQMNAQDVFARALTEQGGQLAYQSAEAERNRQIAASQFAPQLSAADYNDIQALFKAGQAQEGYRLQDIQGKLAAEDLPFNRLQRATNIFYGAPMETTTTQKATPSGGK